MLVMPSKLSWAPTVFSSKNSSLIPKKQNVSRELTAILKEAFICCTIQELMLKSKFGFLPTSKNLKTSSGCSLITIIPASGKQKASKLTMTKKTKFLHAKSPLMSFKISCNPTSYLQLPLKRKKARIRQIWGLLTWETHVTWIPVYKCYFTFVLWGKSFWIPNPATS